MQATTDIGTRQAEAMVRIVRAAVGTTISRAIPSPAPALAKEISITLADAWMLYDVYRVYYEEPPTTERLVELLESAGLTPGTAAGFYGGLRAVQAALARLVGAVPYVGWLLAAMVTCAATLALGTLWQMFLEEVYRRDMGIGMAPPPVRTPSAEPAGVHMGPVGAGAIPEIISTERPDGKPGAVIPRESYDLVRRTIIDLLREAESVPLQDVVDAVAEVEDQLDKSARWYVNVVKLDLEAHGVIERLKGVSPQQLRLVDAS